MGYSRLAIKSFSWVGLLRIIFRAAGFVRTAFLARILTPSQFGVFGIGVIMLGLVEMFTETGINVFLIQDASDSAVEEYLDTAFVVSVLRGIMITLIIWISIPLIIRFFNTKEALPILLVISLVPVVRGFINPAIINFQKQLNFSADFYFRTIIITTDALVAIFTAYILKNPISLAYGLLAGSIVEVILSHLFIKPSPKLNFNQIQFKHIIHQGKWVTSAGVMSYFAGKSPDIALGKIFSTSALGFYQMAYRFAILPIEEISEVINKVSFPIFVKLTNDTPRLKNAFRKNSIVYLSVSAGYCLFILIFAEPLTSLLLGSQWQSITPILKAMSIAGIFYALNSITNPIILAKNHQRQLSHLTMIRLITMLFVIIPLTYNYGIIGSVFAFTLSLLTPLPYRFYLLRKELS
jgi:O-antigen/teichoic acid export membrane protein